MSDLPLWMGCVPSYEVVNGNMHVSSGEFTLAMPINVFLVGCAKGQAAILKWESRKQREAKIIPLRRELNSGH